MPWNAKNCMSIHRMHTDRQALGFELSHATCRTDYHQGPKGGLVCVISPACFEASWQLDFKPVLVMFFSPVITFAAQILLQWPCICLIDMYNVLPNAASWKCDLYLNIPQLCQHEPLSKNTSWLWFWLHFISFSVSAAPCTEPALQEWWMALLIVSNW